MAQKCLLILIAAFMGSASAWNFELPEIFRFARQAQSYGFQRSCGDTTGLGADDIPLNIDNTGLIVSSPSNCELRITYDSTSNLKGWDQICFYDMPEECQVTFYQNYYHSTVQLKSMKGVKCACLNLWFNVLVIYNNACTKSMKVKAVSSGTDECSKLLGLA